MKDKSNKLDDIIRKKMTDLGSAYRPETWDLLSDRLDAMEGTSDPLDRIIRDKIAGLAPTYRPETWDLLSDRLDAMEGAPDPLDRIIRDKMAGLAPTYRPETWDSLNERLEGMEGGSAAGAEMQPLDEAIYEQMHRLEKPYDPNHWPLLLKKLEANAFVGKQIIRYKAMELSLLLLLLITFIRLPLSTTEKQQVLPQSAQPERPQAMAPNMEGIERGVALNSTETEESSGNEAKLNTRERVDINVPQIDLIEQRVQSIDQVEKGTEQLVLIDRSDEFPSVEAPGTIPDLDLLPLQQRELAISTPKIDINALSKVNKPAGNSKILAINPSANALGVMSFLPTTLVHPLCQTCIGGKLDREALSAKQEVFFRIGFQSGPDYNRVITPTTIIKGIEHRADRYSLGYSGGLTFGLEKGRWEIETGLIYSNKRYFPLPVVVLDGSVQSGFFGDGTKQFDLDVFQVPLNFRYNFFRKNRWRIYALAGVSLHVTTQSNYYLANPDDFVTNNYRPLPIPAGQTNPRSTTPTVRSKFDNFTKGWVEGGAFNKNSYLSGNVGIGAEYFITDYWSLYAQPTYGHSLIYLYDGLGPYFDRIHTNSLTFGIKVRLK